MDDEFVELRLVRTRDESPGQALFAGELKVVGEGWGLSHLGVLGSWFSTMGTNESPARKLHEPPDGPCDGE